LELVSPERHLPRLTFVTAAEMSGINKSRLPKRVLISDELDVFLHRYWIGDILVMAHVAKLGALTDELVTLLTLTSAQVSLFRSVS
jgi:hypothetical protein